jgi:hypothetical protein
MQKVTNAPGPISYANKHRGAQSGKASWSKGWLWGVKRAVVYYI